MMIRNRTRTVLTLFTVAMAGFVLHAAAEQAEYKWESNSSDRVSKSIRVERLRCEYRDQPLGIDHPAPRLSWTLESSVRGQKQTAYRVLVARSIQALRAGRGDLWDSGKVESNQSVNIMYAGPARLRPTLFLEGQGLGQRRREFRLERSFILGNGITGGQ